MGIFLALAAACCFGITSVLVRVTLQFENTRPITVTLFSMVVGLILVFSLALVFHFEEMVSLAAISFAWFALLGSIQYPLGRFLNFTSLNMAGVARAAPLLSATPIFAALWAITLGEETLTAVTLLGTILLVAGVALIASEKVRA